MQKNTFDFCPLTIGTMRLGTWGANMSTSEVAGFIEECLSMGLKDFDHADIYGDYTTENDFGKVLKENKALRDQLRIITKCGIKMKGANRPEHLIKSYDLGAEHIRMSVENSLRSLGIDTIDVLLLHRPDLLMDPHEIAEAFNQLKTEGKVQHFGVSNFTTSQFDLLNNATELITNQVEISISHTEAFYDGTLDQCMRYQMRPMAWSPLGGGGIMSNQSDERFVRIRETGNQLADKHNISLDQLLLAWLLKHPAGIIPVLGTSKAERVRKANEALSVHLTREEWYQLLEASVGHEVA